MELEIEGDLIRWIGDPDALHRNDVRRRHDQITHHESSTDGVSWTASMDVTLRKVA